MFRLASFASLVLLPFGYDWVQSPHSLTLNTHGATQLGSHCTAVPPILKPEFNARQVALASVLHKLNASAYITEPSANSQYYANFSLANWKLSERPLLLIIRAQLDGHGEIEPEVTLLTPKFETLRASGLPVVSFKDTPARYIQWPEEFNPYSTALSGLGIPTDSDATLFVDNSIRKFIVDGFQQAGPKLRVASAPLEVTTLRERKSPAELEIMKCANEVTVLAIRDVHRQLSPGMHESQVRGMLSSALGKAGLTNGGCLTLFGSNAALPHGSGTDRVLEPNDFALFDCGGSLHGYISDVTRTVALPGADIPKDHLRIWYAVKEAQASALGSIRAGVLTRKPDEVSRTFLETLGLEQYFTHRLGHGIGLEGHEQPYLRGGTNDIIQPGHTFSNEPGVYIEDKVGVRLEDCFYIGANGKPAYFTAGVGGPSLSPWAP